MFTDTALFHDSDGCDYYYDSRMGRYRKIITLTSFGDLPDAAQRWIRHLKKEAEYIEALPTLTCEVLSQEEINRLLTAINAREEA